MSALLVNKAIEISAPASRVWDTVTKPDLIKKWLSDDAMDVISDWNVGGPIVFTGVWHGYKIKDEGEILAIDPEKLLRYSYWSKSSRLPNNSENNSIIAFTLRSHGSTTLLRVTHSNILLETMYGHANFYWTSAIIRIKKLVEGSTKQTYFQQL